MKARLEEKNQAIELRKQGLSYSEIQKIIPVSKGLLSNWFNNLTLSPDQEKSLHSNLIDRSGRGRINSILVNRRAKLNREIVAFEDAKKIFVDMKSDPTFLIGVTLYWAEGSKKFDFFQFINSDPDMVVFMYSWIQKYLKIDRERIKCRIFTNKVIGYDNIELFWASKLAIQQHILRKTVYKSTRYSHRKNPDYKGCMRLSINSVYIQRLMRAWQKLLIQYYSVMRP